jgi:hypothetical protein
VSFTPRHFSPVLTGWETGLAQNHCPDTEAEKNVHVHIGKRTLVITELSQPTVSLIMAFYTFHEIYRHILISA